MGKEIATAYLSLVPSLKGAGREIQKELGDSRAVQEAGRKSGFGWIKGVGKVAAGAAVTGIGLVAGTAITKGFSRAIQLQDSEKKLEGLGHSSKKISKISANALAAVSGTAYGMGDAMSAAANSVAAGVKPGKDLERTLGLIGDAATIAGSDYGEMSAIFNKVAAANKVQMDVINQLHDQGVPALSLLADEMGVTAAEASKMASKGEIDFETFQRAMENGLGGAALKSGETFRGALANVGASLGRLGAMFATPVVAGGPKLFQSLSGAVDSLGVVLQPVADRFSAWLVPALERAAEMIEKVDFAALFKSVKDGAGPLTQLATAFSPIGVILKAMAPVMPQIGDSLARIGAAIGGVLAKVLPAVADAFARVGAALAGALSKALPSLIPLFNALAAALPKIAPSLTVLVGLVAGLAVAALNLVTPLLGNEKAVAALVTGLIAWKAAVAALGLGRLLVSITQTTKAIALNTIGWVKDKAAMVAHRAVMVATTVATKAAAVAQRALNLVMRANPIGLIITAVAALVAALVWFFTKTKVGKKIVAAAWGGIKKAIQAVSGWWTKTAWPNIKKAIVAMQIGFKVMQAKVRAVWNGIKAVIRTVWNWLKQKVFAPIDKTVKTMWLGFQIARKKVGEAFTSMKNRLKTVFNTIKKVVFLPIGALLDVMKGDFSGAKERVRVVWDAMKRLLRNGYEWIKSKVFGALKSALRGVKTAFTNVKDGVKKTWDKLKAIAAKPINFVIEKVYTGGIKKWWDKIASAVGLSSLKLPPVSPVRFAEGSEDHRAQIARGGAMRLWAEPETGGEAYIPLAQSKRGRSTAILQNVAHRFGYDITPFKDGGFWSDPFGNAWKGIKGVAGKVWDGAKMAVEIVKDPIGAIKKAIAKVVSDKGTGGNAGDLFRMVGQLPAKFAGGLGKKVKSMFESGKGKGAAGSGGGGSAGVGLSGNLSAMASAARALDPSVRVTSGRRAGARTVTGYVSYHAKGRALDMVASNMGRLWDKLYAKFGKRSPELFFSGRSFSRFGKKGAPRSDHWDHVHWVLANGGILPRVFDRGGILHKGLNLVDNRTGKPEPLYTERHMDAAASGPVDLSERTIQRLADALLAGAAVGTNQALSQQARAKAGMRRGNGREW